jgi:hypothetical protein
MLVLVVRAHIKVEIAFIIITTRVVDQPRLLPQNPSLSTSVCAMGGKKKEILAPYTQFKLQFIEQRKNRLKNLQYIDSLHCSERLCI